MTYYINPIWFYLINVSAGMRMILCVLGGAVFGIFVFLFIGWLMDIDITDLEDDEKKILKLFKKIIIASFITLFIGILVPSKETCIEMMIASQVTHENVTATKEEMYELIDYVTAKVKGEAKDGDNE